MPNFNKSLNNNEIYEFIANMIISQKIYDITTANPSLADALRVDGTLYGDTKLYYSMDIGESYDWQNDAEAANLLAVNRNKTQFCQAIMINIFRQTNVTVDHYLTKRAWLNEGSFADFTGVLISSLNGVKRIYDNGLINTFVGTQVSSAPAANITVMSDAVENAQSADDEAKNRAFGQKVAKTMADLGVELGDNVRSFNELGYTRSTPISECIVVYNSLKYNSILSIDLPTIYHNEALKPKATFVLAPRYFGTVNSGTAIGNTTPITTIKGVTVPGKGNGTGTIRSLIEQTIGTVHYFPGDAIATSSTAPAGTSYTEDNTIISKVFPAEAIPFMSAFVTGTMHVNARSLTENHYLTWGHNTLERILERPYVTLKASA